MNVKMMHVNAFSEKEKKQIVAKAFRNFKGLHQFAFRVVSRFLRWLLLYLIDPRKPTSPEHLEWK